MFDESFVEAWNLRFGGGAPDCERPMPAHFLSHRSVRSFADQKLSDGTLRTLVGVAQSGSTSSNLQLFTILNVTDPDKKAACARISEMEFVKDAPHFFLFLGDLHRLRQAGERVGEACAGLDYMEFVVMAAVDGTIAAERMACAAENLGMGCCYVGAMRNDVNAVKELFQLPKGVLPLFGLAFGYTAEPVTAEIKPRFGQEVVFAENVYPTTFDLTEYEARMREFYVSQGMKGEVTWSMRSARRVDGKHMTGREALKPFVESQEMGIR